MPEELTGRRAGGRLNMRIQENICIHRFRRRSYRRAALCACLIGVPAAASAVDYDIRTPMSVASGQAVNLSGHVQVTSPLWVGNGASIYLNVTGGLVGMGKAPSGARLDVQSTGSGKVQIWRDSGGVEKASMSDAGVLTPGCNPDPMTDYPAGAVVFMNGASCPTGWSELTAARGRYMIGKPSGGTLAGTQGTALSNLENRPVGQHLHPINDPGHTHTMEAVGDYDRCCFYDGSSIYDTQNGGSTGSSYTGITTTQNTGPSGTHAPYMQLLICRKD